ncbi:TPA: hypothetical protein QDA76_002241 [Burkholderia vietnamiensis]|nr:hypothetical protein [Burkholderia vietnamiensis]HDR9261393.1 hypothetical protein [Burkholderia vietnamiensis]
MNEIKDGGPAFPEVPGDCNGYEGKPGMTLRDYFAAKAMETLPAPPNRVGAAENRRDLDSWAARCYALADAMLRARGEA